MLTSLDRENIELKFKRALENSEIIKKEVLEILKKCNEQEKFCLKYLYAYMPLTDMADYSPDLFLKFVKHALKVREIMPWGKSIEEADFLNYVLQYRINNENIEYFCEIFFNELYEKVKDLSMYNAIIETNYWAFSKATYKASDDRTASPLTTVKNAYGRCGEESTFLVAALRSIGIPARQCYAPRWTHCDDNHAWVEVLAEGKWHFLGACEPEIKLDRGWFRLPASKAPLIHNRVFSDIVGNEIITKQTDMVTEVNILNHYAETKKLTVKVIDDSGNAMKDVYVAFQVVNYCEFYAITTLQTNENGEVSLDTGLGDLFIFVYNEKGYNYQKVDVRKTQNITITLGYIKEETEGFELEFIPAKGGIDEEEKLTDEEEKQQTIRNEKSLKIRKDFEATFYDEEKAKIYANKFDSMQEEIQKIMPLARGNYLEIERFLEDTKTKNILEYKVKLLLALRYKDLSDILFTTLMENIEESMEYKDKYEKNIFIENVINPRVWNENITSYKKGIKEILTDEEKERIIRNPKEVGNLVEQKVSVYTVSEYTNLSTSPLGALKLKLVNKLSKSILTVAILRTLGIASKMDKKDGKVLYFENGEWNQVYKEVDVKVKKGKLLLKKDSETEFEYYKNYTIGIQEKMYYNTLDLEGIIWENGVAEYELEVGNYRIVTANRRPDEANLVKVFFAKVEEGKTSEVTISLSNIELEAKEVNIQDRKLFDKDDKEISLFEALDGKKSIIAWLHVGMEPTEHLLNEIREAKDKYNNTEINTILILKNIKDLNDPTLIKTFKVIPNLKILIEKDGYNIDNIYKDFDITDKKLPLAIVLNHNQKAVYACAGYNVGIGEMLLKNL